MVGPRTEEERALSARQLGLAFVGLVGASTGLVALQGDASPLQILGAVVVGLLVGVALMRYLVWIAR